MSNSLLKTFYLVLKYALKRKINRIGYALNKKKDSKSRKAVGKKDKGILGSMLGFFGILYFFAIGIFVIYSYTSQIITLDQYQKIISQHKIPSNLSENEIRELHLKFKERFEKYNLLKEQSEIELEWKNIWNDFYDAVALKYSDSQEPHSTIEPIFQINLGARFTEYIESGICPLESTQVKLTLISQNSPYLNIFYLLIGLIVITSLFSSLGFSIIELGVTDKYYEWLAYNSLPINSLYLFRLFENAFSNVVNWLFFLPTLIFIYTAVNGPKYIPIALFMWLIWSILMGALQVLTELFFQHFAGLKHAKTFQAVSSVLGTMAMLILILGNSGIEIKEQALLAIQPFANFFKWIPFFYLPFLNALDGNAYLALICQVVFVSLGVYFVYYLSQKLTKNGLITNATIYSNKRDKLFLSKLSLKSSSLHPVIAFEKLMLYRNKQILISALLTPSILFGFYYYSFKFQAKTLLEPKNISITAFALCSYVYLFTTFTFVQREGKGLWLIFTMPIEASEYFFKKIWVWVSFSYFFFLLVYALYFIFGGVLSVELVINLIIVMIGVAVYGYISTGIGILGYDPAIANQAHRVSKSYIYLYMYLCGFYTSSLFTENLFVKFYIVILAVTIAFALKVKVKSAMKYYLDKNDSENLLTIYEAILLIFFYTSIFITVQIISFAVDKDHQNIFLSGIIASSILMIILIFCGRVFTEIKQIGVELIRFYRHKLFSLRLYAYIAISLIVAGGYLYVMHRYNFFGINDQKTEAFPVPYALLAIFVAPLVEEILFRRILFKTMKDHFSPLSAILYSSCLFALAHPPSSFIPVFFLGCLSASLYHKNNQIHQSILLHTFYNTGVCLITIYQ